LNLNEAGEVLRVFQNWTVFDLN